MRRSSTKSKCGNWKRIYVFGITLQFLCVIKCGFNWIHSIFWPIFGIIFYKNRLTLINYCIYFFQIHRLETLKSLHDQGMFILVDKLNIVTKVT